MTGVFLLSSALALAGGATLWLALADTQRREVRQRLAAISGVRPAGLSESSILAEPFINAGGLGQRLEMLGWRPARVLLAGGAALLLLFAIVTLLDGLLPASVSAIVALGAMVKGFSILAARAQTRFTEDLPLVVDRLRQLILAGNSLTLAFDKAIRTSPPHMARLLAPAGLAVARGMTLADALHHRAARLGSPDLFLLAAIVKTSTQFGGDFSSALKHFETVLTNRVRCRREIRALTSELRMTTFILLSLPVVTALGIFFANRDYIRFFVEEPQGLPALIYVGCSIAIGVFLVSRLSRVEY